VKLFFVDQDVIHRHFQPNFKVVKHAPEGDGVEFPGVIMDGLSGDGVMVHLDGTFKIEYFHANKLHPLTCKRKRVRATTSSTNEKN
jgi:hypothetical protein